ncbi:hypothetical protein JFU54_28750 [Bacillus sp. TH19]|uniref:hypothetical protein n=1 Tax=Bacillus sp. TH19 TaxID=2796385 RepID=UPI0019147673|nr:hypothetical protein [Bacillus sp. TH19]MBK5474377.1 hypothetical protein [Bacillus sp. TH19]
MEQVVKFMKELIESMSEDTYHWYITGVEEFEEVVEDDEVYAKLSDGSLYEKQDDIYIHQTSGYCEDDYSGTIIKPITATIALIISYQC